MPVQAKYFHSSDSTGLLEADVKGRRLVVRSWWTEDAAGDTAIVFARIALYPGAYLYVAIHWISRTILGTAFGPTNRDTRRALIEDLRRRGWWLSVGGPVRYFHSNSSVGYMESVVHGEVLTVRAWWDADNDDEAVIFLRIANYPASYLYVAVQFDRRAIVGTSFAETDKRARRVLLDDLERRGWRFG